MKVQIECLQFLSVRLKQCLDKIPWRDQGLIAHISQPSVAGSVGYDEFENGQMGTYLQ